MDTVLFVFICIAFVACLAVFIVIMALPPKKVNPPAANPVFPLPLSYVGGLQQSFDQSDGSIHVSEDVKPFALQSVTNGPLKPAFVYSGPLTFSPAETTPMSRGFTFAVTSPVSVVGLQVIDSLFASGSRSVGIYNVAQKQLLCNAIVSKVTDPVFNGMRTKTLNLPVDVVLLPNVLYACVAQTQVGDFYVLNTTYAFPPHDIIMDPLLDDAKLGVGYVGSVPSQTLALPTNFVSTGPSSPFASLQIQAKHILFNSFAVDTQYARFPPRYANGLSVLVPDIDKIFVSPGVCSSIYDNANLIANSTIKVTVTPSDLTQDTWYAVYLADEHYNDNVTEILIDPNWLETPQLAIDRMRRIGWARTKPTSTNFFLMEQQGTNIARSTFYLEPAIFASEVVTPANDDGSTIVLVLNFVPPTATQATIQVHAEWQTPATNAFSIDFDGTNEPFFNQREQVQTIPLALTSTSIPQEVVCTLHLPAGGTNPLALSFSIIGFVENL